MARTCSVCTHPERAAIEGRLVAGASARQVAAECRVSHDAVSRHAANHLPETLVRAAQAVAAVRTEQTQAALDVMAELRRTFDRTNLLFDACDRWLRDPDDATRYTVEPRADEVLVLYEEADAEGKVHRRKAPLDHLLARLVAEGLTPVGWETKHADPRELLLKTVAQLRPSIELLAKLLGDLDERPTINLVASPEWLSTRAALLEALAPYPEARTAVATRLQALESRNGHAGE